MKILASQSNLDQAEQAVGRSHAEKTKVAMLDVLAQPSHLLLVTSGVGRNDKLLLEDVGGRASHLGLNKVGSHQRDIVVDAELLTNNVRVDAELELSLSHVVVLLAHDPALGGRRSAEGVENGSEVRGQVVDARVGNDVDLVGGVDPIGTVRAVQAEGATDTARVESQLVIHGGVVEVLAEPLGTGLGVVTKSVEELSDEDVGD